MLLLLVASQLNFAQKTSVEKCLDLFLPVCRGHDRQPPNSSIASLFSTAVALEFRFEFACKQALLCSFDMHVPKSCDCAKSRRCRMELYIGAKIAIGLPEMKRRMPTLSVSVARSRSGSSPPMPWRSDYD